ncbi:MAG: hypothetical protein K5906_04680 [Bacilli bacterium]|nr:hypothetical protein [Bacilli bacterium]
MRKFFIYLYTAVMLICLLYGISMTMNNIGKNLNMVIFHLVITGVGVVMLIIAIIYLNHMKRKMNKINENEVEEKENDGE